MEGVKRCKKCGEEKSASSFGRNKANRDGMVTYCKLCMSAYRKASYQTNRGRSTLQRRERWASDSVYRESQLEKQRAYRANSPNAKAASTERSRRYAETHSEELSNYRRAYYIQRKSDNLGILRKQGRKATARWRAKQDLSQSRDSMKAYRKANPEKIRASIALRKARKLGATTQNAVTARTISDLYTSSKGRCFYCETELDGRYEVDHYVPLSRGGLHDPNNLRIACAPCNRSKHAKMPEDFMRVLPELHRERASFQRSALIQ